MPALEAAQEAVKRLRGRVDLDLEAQLLIGLAAAEALTAVADEIRGLGTEAHPIYTREA
jgi:hypothetical protein